MQMMITREELIEKMAEAIINQAEYSIAPEKRQEQLREQQPYWSDVAEAALDALLSSLPEPTPGYQNKHDMYYRQLMSMKK